MDHPKEESEPPPAEATASAPAPSSPGKTSPPPPPISAQPDAEAAPRPQKKDLHQGWEPTSVAMAKCDMCSRAGRGVIYKCIQCKLSTCKECCENGRLDSDSRHELDAASVSWVPVPKPKTPRGTRGSRTRLPTQRSTRSRTARAATLPETIEQPRNMPPLAPAISPSPAPGGGSGGGGFSHSEREPGHMEMPPPRHHHHHLEPTPVFAGGRSLAPPHAPPQQPHVRFAPTVAGSPAPRHRTTAAPAEDLYGASPRHRLTREDQRPTTYRATPYDRPSTQRGSDPPPRMDPYQHQHHPSHPVYPPDGPVNRPPDPASWAAAPAAPAAPDGRREECIQLPSINTWLYISPRPRWQEPQQPQEPGRVVDPHLGYPAADDQAANSQDVSALGARLAHSAWEVRGEYSETTVDLCLRHEVASHWARRMLPGRGMTFDDSIELFLRGAHAAALRLGLDPVRNGARDWLLQIRAIFESGEYDPIYSMRATRR